MSRVYLIPGFTFAADGEPYVAVGQLFAQHGFEAVACRVDWQRTVMTDWVEQVAGQIEETIHPGDCLFGFSFGAMVALVLASRFQFSALYLASMSPFFKQQLATLPQSWQRSIGIRRVKDFATYDLQSLASTISASTTLFIGELESQKWPFMLESVETAHQLITTSRIVKVPKTGHDLASQDYMRSIAESLID